MREADFSRLKRGDRLKNDDGITYTILALLDSDEFLV